ncbi:hypothetical protein TNCV_1549301 [Trichonephila clavipes]|nr:hypothetical protein TNCV_1549301 [Trichonephila clavipes]
MGSSEMRRYLQRFRKKMDQSGPVPLNCNRNGFSKEFGGALGQRTLWRAKLYPCTACWPIGIVKFTARTLKRMIFRVVRSTYLRVGVRTLGGFSLTSTWSDTSLPISGLPAEP